MALPWWLATTACTAPPGSLADALAFLFLSPYPQRALLGAVDLVFLAACLFHLAHRRRRGAPGASAPAERETLLQKPNHPPPPLFRYVLALGASAVLAAASVVLLALALPLLPSTMPWRAAESAFLAVHAVALGAAAWTVACSRRAGAALDAAHLRVFWLATALGALLFSASAAVRGADASLLFPDDVLAFASLPVSLSLAYIAATGFTVHGDGGAEQEAEPERAAPEAPSSPYAAASFISRATFSWITSLINKGYAADSLAVEDVPPVSAGHRTEASHALFMSNWPSSPASRHPVGVALWLSFWPHLVLTAVFGLARLAAMYVGPSLIDQFVKFIRSGTGTPWEGLRLVLILLVTHHYSFQGTILGMRIRSALQTALYRKSLRLTAGARRAHGAGAIVNYMNVDAAIVSFAMNGLHGLWLMPPQIVVALLLLYSYLGPAVLMTLAVITAGDRGHRVRQQAQPGVPAQVQQVKETARASSPETAAFHGTAPASFRSQQETAASLAAAAGCGVRLSRQPTLRKGREPGRRQRTDNAESVSGGR